MKKLHEKKSSYLTKVAFIVWLIWMLTYLVVAIGAAWGAHPDAFGRRWQGGPLCNGWKSPTIEALMIPVIRRAYEMERMADGTGLEVSIIIMGCPETKSFLPFPAYEQRVPHGTTYQWRTHVFNLDGSRFDRPGWVPVARVMFYKIKEHYDERGI